MLGALGPPVASHTSLGGGSCHRFTEEETETAGHETWSRWLSSKGHRASTRTGRPGLQQVAAGRRGPEANAQSCGAAGRGWPGRVASPGVACFEPQGPLCCLGPPETSVVPSLCGPPSKAISDSPSAHSSQEPLLLLLQQRDTQKGTSARPAPPRTPSPQRLPQTLDSSLETAPLLSWRHHALSFLLHRCFSRAGSGSSLATHGGHLVSFKTKRMGALFLQTLAEVAWSSPRAPGDSKLCAKPLQPRASFSRVPTSQLSPTHTPPAAETPLPPTVLRPHLTHLLEARGSRSLPLSQSTSFPNSLTP